MDITGIFEAALTTLFNNTMIRLVILAVIMDTIFGVGRAARQHSFNSCVGIDGAIRKISMIVSLVFLVIVDKMVHINLIGFIPESARAYLPGGAVGLAEFFALLYMCYEIVSILKNMYYCGLPVKAIWNRVEKFLEKYTKELPDTEEQDAAQAKEKAAILTDNVPPGAMEPNADGTYNTYDAAGNITGTITKEEYEAAGADVTKVEVE